MSLYTVKRICPVTTLTTSAVTLYTVTEPVTNAVVKQIAVSNFGASATSVTVHFVQNGGSVGNGNIIIPAVSISANSTITLDVTQVLNGGDFIAALASANSALNIAISGYEVQ